MIDLKKEVNHLCSFKVKENKDDSLVVRLYIEPNSAACLDQEVLQGNEASSEKGVILHES